MTEISSNYELAPRPGTPASQRKQELDGARFVSVRNLAYMIYKKPDGTTPLMTYQETLDNRELVKTTIINHEISLGLLQADSGAPVVQQAVQPQTNGAPQMSPSPVGPPQQQMPFQPVQQQPQAMTPQQFAQVPQQAAQQPVYAPPPGQPQFPPPPQQQYAVQPTLAYVPPQAQPPQQQYVQPPQQQQMFAPPPGQPAPGRHMLIQDVPGPNGQVFQGQPPQQMVPQQQMQPQMQAAPAPEGAAPVVTGKKRKGAAGNAVAPPPAINGAPPGFVPQALPPQQAAQQVAQFAPPPPAPQQQQFAPPPQQQYIQQVPPTQGQPDLGSKIDDLGRGLSIAAGNSDAALKAVAKLESTLNEVLLVNYQMLVSLHHLYLTNPQLQPATGGNAVTLKDFQTFLQKYIGNPK